MDHKGYLRHLASLGCDAPLSVGEPIVDEEAMSHVREAGTVTLRLGTTKTRVSALIRGGHGGDLGLSPDNDTGARYGIENCWTYTPRPEKS